MDIVSTPLEAYFLGWMFSDGGIHYSNIAYSFSTKLKIKEEDKDVLDLFNSITKWRRGTEKSKDGFNSCFIQTYNRDFAKSLIRLGVLPNKSGCNKDNLMFPLLRDISLYQYFIRGVFDGDGSYSLVSGRLNIALSMINYHFLIDLKQFLYTHYNIKADLIKREREDSKYLYYLRVRNTKNCKSFIDKVYKDNLHLVLHRKYSIIQKADYSPTFNLKSEASAVQVVQLDGTYIGTWKSCYEIEHLSIKNPDFILNTYSNKGKVPYLTQSNVAASCRTGKPYKGLIYSYIEPCPSKIP